MIHRSVSVALATLALIAPALPEPAAAQEVLTGTVQEVRDEAVRVVLEGRLVPSVGDSAALTNEVPGVGEVRIRGRWRVVEVELAGIWLAAQPGAVLPTPGSRARIFAVRPAPASVTPVATTADNLLLLREGFETETLFGSSDPPCSTRYEGGAFHFRNGVDRGRTCRHLFMEAGALEGTVRVSVTLRTVVNPGGDSFGLIFGYRDGDYYVFDVDDSGKFALFRLEGGRWTTLRDWSPSDALRTGLGATNELEVEISAAGARLLTNGQDLGRVDLPAVQGGFIGLHINETGVEIAADDLRILQVTPPALRVSAPEGPVLTHLDFESSVSALEADTETCRNTVQNGAYRVENVATRATACEWFLFSSARKVEGPARLSARIRLVEGLASEPVGLIFGISDAPTSEFYVFEVDGLGRYKLVRHTDQGWTELTPWTRRGEVHAGVGSENELAVEIEGSWAHLYVNGGFLRSVALPASPLGTVGLYVDEPGQVALFDDLRLVELGR
jgi:hypothetical protein